MAVWLAKWLLWNQGERGKVTIITPYQVSETINAKLLKIV